MLNVTKFTKTRMVLSYHKIDKMRRQKKVQRELKLYRSAVVKIVKIRLRFQVP